MGTAAKMVKKVAKGGAAPKIEFPRSLVVAKKRTFSIGGDILPPKRNLTRFVKWPKYIRPQRSKMTLLKRIKIPPAINQFTNTFDKRQASQLFRLLNNLKPETKTEKKERRNEQADKVADGGKATSKTSMCQAGPQPCDFARRGEEGQARYHRPRCRPYRDHPLAPSPVQVPWCPILHCQEQVSPWLRGWHEDCHLPRHHRCEA